MRARPSSTTGCSGSRTTRPSTETRPATIQRAASDREHRPRLDSTRPSPWRRAGGAWRPAGACLRSLRAAGPEPRSPARGRASGLLSGTGRRMHSVLDVELRPAVLGTTLRVVRTVRALVGHDRPRFAEAHRADQSRLVD